MIGRAFKCDIFELVFMWLYWREVDCYAITCNKPTILTLSFAQEYEILTLPP